MPVFSLGGGIHSRLHDPSGIKATHRPRHMSPMLGMLDAFVGPAQELGLI